MDTIDEVCMRIEELRGKLEKQIEISDNLLSHDIVVISQELDTVINLYNKIYSTSL